MTSSDFETKYFSENFLKNILKDSDNNKKN